MPCTEHLPCSHSPPHNVLVLGWFFLNRAKKQKWVITEFSDVHTGCAYLQMQKWEQLLWEIFTVVISFITVGGFSLSKYEPRGNKSSKIFCRWHAGSCVNMSVLQDQLKFWHSKCLSRGRKLVSQLSPYLFSNTHLHTQAQLHPALI